MWHTNWFGLGPACLILWYDYNHVILSGNPA